MNATIVEVVQNAYGYDIEFNLQNPDGSAFDLTGATSVKINVKFSQTNGIKLTSNLSVIGPASSGIAAYLVGNGDFNQGGIYNAEIEVDTGSAVLIWPNIQIRAYKQVVNM